MEQTKTVLLKAALRNTAKARFALFVSNICIIGTKVSIQAANFDMFSAKQNTKTLTCTLQADYIQNSPCILGVIGAIAAHMCIYMVHH